MMKTQRETNREKEERDETRDSSRVARADKDRDTREQ